MDPFQTKFHIFHKFAGPWPRACQIIGPWTLTMSNILFLQVSSQTGQFWKQTPKLNRKKQHRAQKINIEPQLLQLLLLLLLLLLKLFLVPGARGGCQGASGSGDRQSFLRRVTFFSAPIFGHPPFPHVSVFYAKLVFKQLPKWGPFLRRLILLKCCK